MHARWFGPKTVARSHVKSSPRRISSSVARLLNIRGETKSKLEPESLELEIASHLAEANAHQQHAAFETLIHGPPASEGPDLETATAVAESVYVASLPWIGQQSASMLDLKTARTREPDVVNPLVDAVEASAAIMEGVSGPNVEQGALTVDESLRERDSIIDGDNLVSFSSQPNAVRG